VAGVGTGGTITGVGEVLKKEGGAACSLLWLSCPLVEMPQHREAVKSPGFSCMLKDKHMLNHFVETGCSAGA